MTDGDNKKLGVIALAALVVGAMIGGGIFSLPQNMAQGAAVTAVILAWVITGIGIFFLAQTFRVLADARPDATTGIYAYARLGFGRFAGFEMAWSYWLCNLFGNVGYAVLLMDALNYFFPGQIFMLLMSIATIAATISWLTIVITHLKFRAHCKEVGKDTKFKSPLYPFINYLCIAFLLGIWGLISPTDR